MKKRPFSKNFVLNYLSLLCPTRGSKQLKPDSKNNRVISWIIEYKWLIHLIIGWSNVLCKSNVIVFSNRRLISSLSTFRCPEEKIMPMTEQQQRRRHQFSWRRQPGQNILTHLFATWNHFRMNSQFSKKVRLWWNVINSLLN